MTNIIENRKDHLLDKSLERELLNYLYFDLNRIRFIVKDEIFEYDVQSSIHQFLKYRLKNKGLKIIREKEKIDHVIQRLDTEGKPEHSALIEVKSFIKVRENLRLPPILKDITKLHERIGPGMAGYFVLVVKESHLRSRNKELEHLVTALSGTSRTYKFLDGKAKISTRIIRSVRTSYSDKEKNQRPHKSQVRIFMFQLLPSNKN